MKNDFAALDARARQMGGDEARVALVALSEKPEKLEKQVAEQLTLPPEKKGLMTRAGPSRILHVR